MVLLSAGVVHNTLNRYSLRHEIAMTAQGSFGGTCGLEETDSMSRWSEFQSHTATMLEDQRMFLDRSDAEDIEATTAVFQ